MIGFIIGVVVGVILAAAVPKVYAWGVRTWKKRNELKIP